MTATTHIGKDLAARAAGDRAGAPDGQTAAPGGRNSLGRRLGLRLWAILHAQDLLNGGAEARYLAR